MHQKTTFPAIKTLSLIAAGLLTLGTPEDARAQAPALYNTISGVVWRENSGSVDGIRQAYEYTRVAGVMAVLRDYNTYKVIASALSNDTGAFTLNNYAGAGEYQLEYYFPTAGFTVGQQRAGTDNTLNSAADPNSIDLSNNFVATPSFQITTPTNMDTFGLALVRVPNTHTYWVTKPMTQPDWNDVLYLPKWNPSLNNNQTLNRVTIFTNETNFHPQVRIENESTTSSATGIIEVTGRIAATLPTGSSYNVNSYVANVTPLAPYDGVKDYGGASGYTWYNQYGAGTGSTYTTNATHLSTTYSSNTANETIGISLSATALVTMEVGSNTTANISTTIGAGVFVVYKFNGTDITPLPLSLISFNAVKDQHTALINWNAISDGTPNESYTIEHSTDGRRFTAIGQVAANTDTKESVSYQFRHEQPAAGKNFYRLRLNETGDKQTYSAVATVVIGHISEVSVFPNPASTSLHIDGASQLGSIRMYDISGRMMEVPVQTMGDRATLNTSALPNGTYLLQLIHTDGTIQSRQLLIQHS